MTSHRRFERAVYALLLASALMPAISGGQIPGRPQERPIAIVGATVHPVSGPAIPGGTILFDKGKILAVGQAVDVPAGCDVVRADGKHVYPGLVSGETRIGLTEIGAVRATHDMEETGQINPNVRAERAFNPESELIPVTRTNGILTVVSAPSGGLISGLSAVMMLDGWTWEDMTLKAPAALVVQWPDMSIRRGGESSPGEDEQRKQREKALAELENAFRDARAYWQAKLAAGSPGLSPRKTDIRWEAMIPVLDNSIPVVAWANDVDQIQAAVAWAEREGIRLVIGGGNDSWQVADLLRAKKVPVLVGGTLRLPDRRFEGYDTPFTLPDKLYRAGVDFAITSTDRETHARNLPYHAAMAAAFGLPKEEALRSVTLAPARIFGVADRIGSLEPGKDATLIVTSGDPLEITSRIEKAYIQGRTVDLSNKQTRLYDKYREKYRRTTGGQK